MAKNTLGTACYVVLLSFFDDEYIHFSQFVDVYVYRKQVFWAVKLRASCTSASVMLMLNSAEILYQHKMSSAI